MGTWQECCYTAFVTDACTKAIKGRALQRPCCTEDLPLQGFNHAVSQAGSNLIEWCIIPTTNRSTYR
jgi:hypothetical protein